MEIRPTSVVVVRAPNRLPLADIEQFLLLRKDWIDRQLAKLAQRQQRIPQRTHEQHFYHRGQVLSWGWQGADLIVPHRHATPEAALRWVSSWQRAEAKRVFSDVLAEVLPLVGVHGLRYTGIQLRKMRRRWGSCTRTGVITLNEHLIRAPDICIRAVVVHEACHLAYMDHGKGFRQLEAEIFPEHKLADELLEGWASVLTLDAGADLVEGRG